MRRTKITSIIALILVMIFASSSVFGVVAASSTDSDDSVLSGTVAEAIEILGDIKWKQYASQLVGASLYTGNPVAVDMKSATYDAEGTDETTLSTKFDKNAVRDGVPCVDMPEAGSVTFKVNVPETGIYAIGWDYYDIVCKSTNIERTLRIDGEVPFNEVRNLLLTKNWIDEYEYDENGNIVFAKDGSGNERRPAKLSAPQWNEYTVSDPTGFYDGAFFFLLEKGEHTITLQAQKEPIAIANIVLKEFTTNITYAEYKADIESKYNKAPQDAFIKIEGENPWRTSDCTLYPVNDRSSSVTSPQDAAYGVMNTIGGSTWQTMGQWIEWKFNVEPGMAGIYQIDARFMQNAIEGLYVSRRLYVDGVVPFEEANGVHFDFKNGWQVTTLGDGEPFEFYFSEGEHIIKLEVVYGDIAGIVSEIREALDEINKIYIKILQIAGTTPDADTSYQFYARIPSDIVRMGELSQELAGISERLKELGKGAGSNSATIDNVARVLAKMARDSESQIAKQFGALKSYIGNLGTMLNTIAEQQLMVDYFVVKSPDNKTKIRAEGNFFQNAWYEICRFVASFTVDSASFKSSASTAENATQIEVWTTTSREKTQLIRALMDEDFAAKHPEIAVNVKIVSAGSLLPATLSGKGPDVMMDVAQSDAINYAVRGAVLDVSGFNGYDELASRFHASALAPLTVALGSSEGRKAVFGIPQTQSFEVMFYRKDVFADIGADVPSTWDDFYLLLSKLLSKNYQVGIPTASLGFDVTLVYQHGGSLYGDHGKTIALDQEAALSAFTMVCDLVNLYSCPISYDAANRFRTGEMPLLLADYISFYNQFTVYATELKGLWGFTMIPGYVNEDGTVNNANVSTITAMVIMKDAAARGTAEASFEFLKWWMEEDVQGNYANELVALLGPAGKYNTANYNAFNAMPWSASELKVLNTLFQHLKGYPEMPGGYIINRYVSFAFNETYNNGTVPSEALLAYIPAINSELARKRAELEDGKDESRSFFIPTDSISQ